jgi:hypothetical protein
MRVKQVFSILFMICISMMSFVRSTEITDPVQNYTSDTGEYGFWWEMSTYNGWDMPFAKRCEITGISG